MKNSEFGLRASQASHDSVALTLPDLPNHAIKRGILVPTWSQLSELVPTCLHLNPDADDGRVFAFLSSIGRGLRKASCQIRVTLYAPGYYEERVTPVRFGGPQRTQDSTYSIAFRAHPHCRMIIFPNR